MQSVTMSRSIARVSPGMRVSRSLNTSEKKVSRVFISRLGFSSVLLGVALPVMTHESMPRLPLSRGATFS